MSKRFVITEEEKNQIRGMYNLITEATEEDIKKMFESKFPTCFNFNAPNSKFYEEGGKFYYQHYSKLQKGDVKVDLDGNIYILGGLMQGSQRKIDQKCDKTSVKKSPNEIEVENLFKKNLPCYNIEEEVPFKFLIKSPEGHLMTALQLKPYTLYTNPITKQVITKGGLSDGMVLQYSCENGKLIEKKITSGTEKNVHQRNPQTYFKNVTKEEPIVFGMRDRLQNEDGIIFQIQKKLKELNYYKAEPDGQFGPKTYNAIIQFQKANKDTEGNPLKPDGKVGPQTIQALGLKD